MATPPSKPEKKWYHIEDIFTRIDEQLEKLIDLQSKQLTILNSILYTLTQQPPPGQPPTLPSINIANIKELADEITRKLVKLPNRLERIDIDTSKTTWRSLRKSGLLKPPVLLGFWIEDVGGGFSYKIIREGIGKDEKTASTGDKWDQEFDDLEVKGTGTSGTAKIWVYWRQ